MESIERDEVIKIKSFDWDKAKNFYYVAKFKSVSEASKFLHTSQSSMSRKIILLEEALNCQLLIRNRHGVTPTRKGEELFAIIEDTFLRLKHFNYNSTSMSHNGQKRKIRICATQPYAAYILSQKLIEYNQLHPDLVFEIITDDHMIDLAVNDVDMAIRPYDENAQNIVQEHLSTVEKKIFASAEYINKYGEPKSIDDLKNHHIIAYARPEAHPYSDVNWILRLGNKNKELHEPIFTSTSLEILVEAAQKGLGIIATFEEMSIIKNSGLIKILTKVNGSFNNDFICYPNYLLEDQCFIDFKNCVLRTFKYLRK